MLNTADRDHSNLLLEINDFNKNTKTRNFSKKSKKDILLMKVEKWFVILVKVQYFL